MNLRVNFWVNKVGNLNSHHQGLSQEQVDALKSLKVGDRLVMWEEKKRSKETDPHYVLRHDVSASASKAPGLKVNPVVAVVTETTTTVVTDGTEAPKRNTFRRTEEPKFE